MLARRLSATLRIEHSAMTPSATENTQKNNVPRARRVSLTASPAATESFITRPPKRSGGPLARWGPLIPTPLAYRGRPVEPSAEAGDVLTTSLVPGLVIPVGQVFEV